MTTKRRSTIANEASAMPASLTTPVPSAKGTRLLRVLLHFNKPAWQRSGKIKWTVHFRGKCHIVDHIIGFVKLETHTQRRQPVAILRGFARRVEVFAENNGLAIRMTARIT